MKCHGCSTLMVLDKQETGTNSCTQWHSCPLCGKVRLTSEPNSGLDSLHSAAQRRSNKIASDNAAGSTRKGAPNFA